jgi:3-dehydroquinate synthase
MSTDSEKFVVSSAQGDYPVVFRKYANELIEMFSTSGDDFYIVDRNVWEIYKNGLTFVNQDKMLLLEANEETKSLNGTTKVIEWLNINGATKSSKIVGIGGGVIQDISTFVAHIYYRGIKWVYIPTTLLSQSDSCIGAKCGINVLSHKNQVGVLHSPSAVYVVEEFLSTLSKEEYESGFGEIFKLAVTGPNQFYEYLKEHLNSHGLSHLHVLPINAKSLMAKKAIIEVDEYENDLRRILNYGHSFGHSLESLTQNRVTHGYAVLFGMDLINFLGVQWGITSSKFDEDFRSQIKRYFPELSIERIDVTQLVQGLRKDKKVLHGKINFAIVKDVGARIVVPKEIDEELEDLVARYLSNVCQFYSA